MAKSTLLQRSIRREAFNVRVWIMVLLLDRSGLWPVSDKTFVYLFWIMVFFTVTMRLVPAHWVFESKEGE